MGIYFNVTKKKNQRILIQRPDIQSVEQEELWREVHKYARLIPTEPEPNLGRVREIKEEINKGTYLIPDMIDETAARLVIRFMKKD